ncbi:MAG: transcription elongation factor GreA [Ruminiclostridium sp.]|nr:transcription elongation factor GreA [Ruminiclostridium sp.]
MAKQTVLTSEGLQNLEKELEELKTVKRREVTEKIKVALGYGDLSENSEYDEAKNEQGLIEARIAEIEALLKNVKILDSDNISTEHVQLGNTVKIKNLADDKVIELSIVGSKEVDMMQGKISDESPIGRALMGHATGDVVDVDAPAGVFKYEILEIGRL